MIAKIKLRDIETKIARNSFTRNLSLSFIFGTLNALSMAPIGLVIILPITLSAFILLTRKALNKKQAFFNGWAFGAGYFIFSLYWVSYALLVDLANWWWLIPVSLIIAPTIIGIYYGFIPLIARRYKTNKDLYAIATCFAFALIEFLRGTLFTGFPWNLTGYSWQHFLPMMQINAYIGIYGLTLLTFIWSVFFIIKNSAARKAIAISFVIAIALGTYRVSTTKIEHYKNAAVRVVQPNIEQKYKWDPKHRYQNFETLLDLTTSSNDKELPIKFVIWPETSTLYKLNRSTRMLDVTAAALPNSDAIGIVGSMNTVGEDYWASEIYNSVSFISKKDKMVASYNKHHLVPFGEYIPYRNILSMSPFANSVAMVGDFSRGTGAKTIILGEDTPSPSPLICYEAIFPSEVTNKDKRPEWLLNVTNDAWYGKSAGPYQHFENVRVRAIEEGLTMVRSANTGISAIINPLGIIEERLELGTQGKIDALLPKPLTQTLFSKFGNNIFFGAMITLLALLEFSRNKTSKNK